MQNMPGLCATGCYRMCGNSIRCRNNAAMTTAISKETHPIRSLIG